MKKILLSIAAVAIVATTSFSGQAQAKGCLKGAAVGAVGGHVAGGHGVIGAAGGCVVGRHMANKKEKEQEQQQKNNSANQSPAPAGATAPSN